MHGGYQEHTIYTGRHFITVFIIQVIRFYWVTVTELQWQRDKNQCHIIQLYSTTITLWNTPFRPWRFRSTVTFSFWGGDCNCRYQLLCSMKTHNAHTHWSAPCIHASTHTQTWVCPEMQLCEWMLPLWRRCTNSFSNTCSLLSECPACVPFIWLWCLIF